MKIFGLLCAITAIAQSCFALEPADAARIVYYFTCYDFDASVWGPNKGYLAPKCKGSKLADKKCTFDEFVNYLFTGKPTTEPKYYETSTDFSLFSGDVAAMVEALRIIDSTSNPDLNLFLKNRKTAIGLFNDLAQITEINSDQAKIKGLGAKRHLSNIKQGLGGFRLHMSAQLEGSLTERMQNYQKNVIWKTVERESSYAKYKWKRIDWELTVLANPDLASRKSSLYKNTVQILKGFDELEGTLRDKTMAFKAANSFNSCFLTSP